MFIENLLTQKFINPKKILTRFFLPQKYSKKIGDQKISLIDFRWISCPSPVNIFTDRLVNSGLRSKYLLSGENPVISGENWSFSGRSPVDFSDSPESWDRGVKLSFYTISDGQISGQNNSSIMKAFVVPITHKSRIKCEKNTNRRSRIRDSTPALVLFSPLLLP